MKSLNEILDLARKIGPKKIAVAAPEDDEVLRALDQAAKEKIIRGILIGNRNNIKKICKEEDINLEDFEIIDEPDGFKASLMCCGLVNQKKAALMMKGLVGTAAFLKAILDKEKGLTTGRLLSHLAVFEIPSYPRLLMLTDVAINISPDLSEKAQIIQNAVDMAHCLGIQRPFVACIAAIEKINPDKMPSTVDAAALSMMAKRGQIKGAVVDGPFGLDNAVSVEAARIKGIKSEIAGKADILLVPYIESGNVIYKTLTELARAKCAAIVLGARSPVVLTSRADNYETKFISIALGVAGCGIE
ncbi:MAG: phosphate butyryltransferase [Candidatus Zixiibacteriota bacterium]